MHSYFYNHTVTFTGALWVFAHVRACVCVCVWITFCGYLLSAWRNSFSVSYNAGRLAIKSISFVYLGMSFILYSFLKDSFAGYRIFGWQFFFLWAICICYSPVFWLLLSLLRGQLSVFSLKWLVIFLLPLLRFSHNLTFSTFTVMCLDLLAFFLLGVCWASWICWSLLFNKFGKFSVIMSSNIFFYSLLSSLYGTPIMYIWYTFWCPTDLWSSVHFSSSFFFLTVLQIS